MANELVKRYTRLAKSYKDTPQNRTGVLLPFCRELLQLPAEERLPLPDVAEELLYVTVKTRYGESWEPCSNDRRTFIEATKLFFLDSRNANHSSLGRLDFDFLLELLAVHCPPWFDAAINFPNGTPLYSLDYFQYMKLHEKGYLKEIKPQAIAILVAGLTEVRQQVEWSERQPSYSYAPLWQDERIMKEYIWYLFDYSTPAPETDKMIKEWLKGGRMKEDMSFAAFFARCAQDGRMDRTRLIGAAINSYLKNLSDAQNAWLTDILQRLKPTAAELLPLQDVLLKVLLIPGIKTIMPQLKLLRQAAGQPEFHAEAFVSATSPLLFTLPQNAQTTIMAIYDVLAKARPALRPALCAAACTLLATLKEAVQMRAARLIAKYGDKDDAALQAEINAYGPALPPSVREVLAPYITHPIAPAAVVPPLEPQQPQPVCTESNQVTGPQTKDDFIFLFSRLPNMVAAADLWTAIDAANNWFTQLEKQDLERLESVFRQAFACVNGQANPFENGLATFVLEYGRLLERRYRPALPSLKGAIAGLKSLAGGRYTLMQQPFTPLLSLPMMVENTPTSAICVLLKGIIARLERGLTLPVLSTPTHRPCYVSPLTLIDRLAKYEQAGCRPSPLDLQLAINRCAMEQRKEAATYAMEALQGEYRNLMLFLLDDDTDPAPPFNMQAAWVEAGLVKAPETEFAAFSGFKINLKPRKYLTGTYTLPANYEDKPAQKAIRLDCGRTYLSQPFGPKLWQEYLNMEYFFLVSNTYTEAMMSLFPNRPEQLLGQIMNEYMVMDSPANGHRRIICTALGQLMEQSCPLRGMSQLFVAACLVCADAPTRTIAAELWAQRTAQDAIDNTQTGKYLAELLRRHLYPLARLNKLLGEAMLHRSTRHDAQLRRLLAPAVDVAACNRLTGGVQLKKIWDGLAPASE
jgi:hypothetical protein